MRVWPVLFVWDVALETRDCEKVENCLLKTIEYFESHYSLTPEIEIIQLSPVKEVATSKLLPGENRVQLESGHPDRSDLKVKSSEFQQFEHILRQQRVRLGVKGAIAPTIIRFSMRPINRPNHYAALLSDIRHHVNDLSVFEYQAKHPSHRGPHFHAK